MQKSTVRREESVLILLLYLKLQKVIGSVHNKCLIKMKKAMNCMFMHLTQTHCLALSTVVSIQWGSENRSLSENGEPLYF